MKKRNRRIALVLSFMMMAGTVLPVSAAEGSTTIGSAVAGAALLNEGETATGGSCVTTAVAGIALNISDYNNSTSTEQDASEVIASVVNEEESPYENIAITQVKNYVNIRDKASTDGEIVGKIYNKAAATILETVDGEDGQWYYIKSGSVKGYMKAEYFVTGEEAEAIAKEVGEVQCKTTAKTLRLREEPSTESRTLMLLAEDSVYSVLKEDITNDAGETFIQVLVDEGDDESDDDDLTGYVSSEYADVYVEFEEAISKEEEEAEIARQEALKKAEEEAAAAAKAESSSKKSSSSSSKSSSSKSSSKGSAIAAKAQQYAGKLRYVWGGTSLKSGADCSGFVKAIYAAYGISLPHSSRSQASGGKKISKSQLQPGDLVFYSSGGRISHVAIYIGGGKICHEANSRRGCRIDSMTYCGTPCKYVTYLH